MLQAIRERAQGWIAWVIVILISVPFALWGIQEYLGVGAEPVVASVDGQDITERDLDMRFQRFRSELRERLGSAYRPELFDDKKLRQEVLDDMIRNQLVLQASTDMGLRAGDDQVRATILAVPAFQRDGRFDIASYEQALRFQGLSQAQFEHSVRGSLLTAQLSRVIASSELTTPAEAQEAARLRRQKRELSWITLPLARFASDVDIPDSDLEAYYRDNVELFRTPEQARLEYLLLDHAAAGESRDPTEEELQALYEARRDSLAQPEQRRARHILVTVDQGADEASTAEARGRIDAIRARLQAGEDFAVLAKELSQDPGSAGLGGDLGFFEKGLMDPAFEQAVFSMEAGQVSEPVRSRFGYHLIEVTGIQAQRVPSLDEIRDDLKQAARTADSEHRYFELAEQLGNLSYEHPDSLVPAAEALGLQIQQTGWVDRSGGEGILADPKVLRAAFSPEALSKGFNSEVIEVQGEAGQRAVVVRVAEHREASLKPFAEVRDQVVQALRDRQARAAAEAAAGRLLERLRGGESVTQVAGDLEARSSSGLVSRNAAGVPAPVVALGFTLARPAEGAGSFGTTTLPDGSAVVVAVSRVEDGSLDGLAKELREQEARAQARGRAQQYYDQLVSDLLVRADVEYRQVERERSVLNE